MPSPLMRITPSIVAAAKEYLELKRRNLVEQVHIAECYPIPAKEVLDIWDSAQFELRRRGADREFALAYVTVFKKGRIAAEYVPLDAPKGQLSLFD